MNVLSVFHFHTNLRSLWMTLLLWGAGCISISRSVKQVPSRLRPRRMSFCSPRKWDKPSPFTQPFALCLALVSLSLKKQTPDNSRMDPTWKKNKQSKWISLSQRVQWLTYFLKSYFHYKLFTSEEDNCLTKETGWFIILRHIHPYLLILA